MSMLTALKNDADVAEDKDVIGGGFQPLATAIYATRVLLAYLTKSTGGALALNLTLETPDKQQIRQVIYMTSGDAKGNRTFYIDKTDNSKKPMPGFALGNSLAFLTLGKEISDLATEDKVVKIYDYDAKKELPKKVEMIVDLLGQEIWTALFHQVVDKSAKGGDGEYHPTGETREENEIAKFFRATDKLTTAEIKAGATEPKFFTDWEESWKDKTRNRAKGAGTAGAAGAPTLATNNGAAPGGTPAQAQANPAAGTVANTPASTGSKPADSLFT